MCFWGEAACQLAPEIAAPQSSLITQHNSSLPPLGSVSFTWVELTARKPGSMVLFTPPALVNVSPSSAFFSVDLPMVMMLPLEKKGLASGLELLYRDNHLVVVNKPGGLLSVPGRGPTKQDCVVNRLKGLIPSCIGQPAVHRLDMATSGLMVLALTTETHAALSRQFALRQVHKKYFALLEGIPGKEGGEIELAFRLDPQNRPYQVYDPVQGKTGLTRWRLLSSHQKISRVEFTPLTGRTHQLRLHAAHAQGLGCPIVGDPLYGTGREGDQLMLHAVLLAFVHPASGKKVSFTSDPSF